MMNSGFSGEPPSKVGKLTIACVLRSGGEYGPDYVARLAAGVRRHLHIEYAFQCVTDMSDEVGSLGGDLGIAVVPLEHHWPGWFAKIEMLRIPGPVLCFDLDTVIVGDIIPLASVVRSLDGRFLGIGDFYRPPIFQTGLMGWSGDESQAVSDFAEEARWGSWFVQHGRVVCLELPDGRRYDGDAEWLRLWLRKRQRQTVHAQNEVTGICSFKVSVQRTGMLPDGARIVCFHGYPRPHHIADRYQWMAANGWPDGA